MPSALASLAILTQEVHEEVSETVGPENPILPDIAEIIFGGLAFLIVFGVLAKYAFPALNRMLAERAAKIQGEMERAESTRSEAERMLEEYRQQLAGARDEGNRIIEEARKTAEQLRRDVQGRADQDAQAIVARAQEEIRAERDRVFHELRAQVADIAVELAGRVVGQSLDRGTHERLIDEYIDQVASSGDGRG
jgi:F-type H+-transporting ATPase subunit b